MINRQNIFYAVIITISIIFLTSFSLNLKMYEKISEQRKEIAAQSKQLKTANDSLKIIVAKSQRDLLVMSDSLAKIKANVNALQLVKNKQAKQFNANLSALNEKLKQVNESLEYIIVE